MIPFDHVTQHTDTQTSFTQQREAVLEHGGQQRGQARQRHEAERVALLTTREATQSHRQRTRRLRLALIHHLAALLRVC